MIGVVDGDFGPAGATNADACLAVACVLAALPLLSHLLQRHIFRVVLMIRTADAMQVAY